MPPPWGCGTSPSPRSRDDWRKARPHPEPRRAGGRRAGMWTLPSPTPLACGGAGTGRVPPSPKSRWIRGRAPSRCQAGTARGGTSPPFRDAGAPCWAGGLWSHHGTSQCHVPLRVTPGRSQRWGPAGCIQLWAAGRGPWGWWSGDGPKRRVLRWYHPSTHRPGTRWGHGAAPSIARCSCAPCRARVRPSVRPAAGDTGLAVPAGRARRWGTRGSAQGLFPCGSRRFEYMSRSSFNYANWVSEGRAGSEGEWASGSGAWRSARCQLPVPTFCLPPARGHGPRCPPRQEHADVGERLSPAPNNRVGGESHARPPAQPGPGGDAPEPWDQREPLTTSNAGAGVGTPVCERCGQGRGTDGQGRGTDGRSVPARLGACVAPPAQVGRAGPRVVPAGLHRRPQPGHRQHPRGTAVRGPPGSSHCVRARCRGTSQCHPGDMRGTSRRGQDSSRARRADQLAQAIGCYR